MKKKIFWSVCAAAMMSVFAVRAQNTECCQKIPTCAEMGYNLSAPKGDGWFCTACPTDPKKFSCSEKPCPPGASSSINILGSCNGYTTDETRTCYAHCPVGAYNGEKVCFNSKKIQFTSKHRSDREGDAWFFCIGAS